MELEEAKKVLQDIRRHFDISPLYDHWGKQLTKVIECISQLENSPAIDWKALATFIDNEMVNKRIYTGQEIMEDLRENKSKWLKEGGGK